MGKKNKKVLILENEPPLARVLRLKISNRGGECEIAEKAEDALKELRKKDYGYVILNMLLPDMDGFKFLEKIQNLKQRGTVNKDLNVIVFSYLTQDSDVESIKELGAGKIFKKGKDQIIDIINCVA